MGTEDPRCESRVIERKFEFKGSISQCHAPARMHIEYEGLILRCCRQHAVIACRQLQNKHIKFSVTDPETGHVLTQKKSKRTKKDKPETGQLSLLG